MNIHVVTHDDMDGFLWGVLEGWLISGITEQHTVRVSGPNTLLPQAPDFWETFPTTDAILLCVTSAPHTHLARAVAIIDTHKLWHKVVHSDYVHNQELKVAGVARQSRRTLIGKRLKWLKVKDWPNVEWLPRTGIQQRVLDYALTTPWVDWKTVPAVGVYHTFKPAQKHRLPWLACAKRVLPASVLGAMADPPDRVDPVLRRVYGTRHCVTYLEKASRARIGLYLMGGNALGHQFWEFAALRCALVASHPSLHPTPEEETQEWEHFPAPLIEGEDFVYFRNEGELVRHLTELSADPERCERMTESVWQKVQPYLSVPRSQYVLSLLKQEA